MISRVPAILALVCSAAGGNLPAQSTPPPALLVLEKQDASLAIVDPGTRKVLTRVPAGPDPHEVVASPDGKLAYISNYGFGAYNTISVIDLAAQKALARIDLGPLHGPHGLWFAGGELYFTAEANKVIGRYDPSTRRVDWILGTGQNRTHMVVVSNDLGRIFTSNVGSATVNIIEKVTHPAGPRGLPGGTEMTDWNETVVPVGQGAEGFDVSPDGKELWVANAQDGTLSIVDVATKKTTETLDANVQGANRLKFTPDGRLVFVSSLGTGDLAVFDSGTKKEVKRIRLGHGAAGILMQPDGSRVYVACSPDHNVAVIDLAKLEVIGRIETGRGPDGLAWAVR
jgi:YVTN family beta-propeller protein